MDFRKLGMFVLAFGLLVVLAGLTLVATNQPIAGRSGFVGLVDDVLNLSENSDRAAARERGMQTMVAGGVIVFAGFAVRQSLQST